MPGSIYERNLAALRGAGSVLPASGTPAELLYHQPRADGSGTDLRLLTPDGRRIRIHSLRDPLGEAAAHVDAALGPGPGGAVAVIAAGAGHVFEALRGRTGIRILAIEPSPELAQAWLASSSLAALIDEGRVHAIIGPDYRGIDAAARFLQGAHERVPVIANPVFVREFPAQAAEARRVLDRVVEGALANTEARQRFEDTAAHNTIENLPAIVDEADAAALAGAFAGTPGFVLGAGPSLDRNLAALAALQHAGVVICADTALAPALGAGVVPHLAVALDPSALNGRHLARAAHAAPVHLVSETSVHPASVVRFAGRTFFFRVGGHAPWPWLRGAGIETPLLSAWGSVVTSAIDVAVLAGCSPIVLCGLDLAWTARRPYCRGTAFEEDWAAEVLAGRTLDEIWGTALAYRQTAMDVDIHGRPAPTAPHLVAVRDWIADYAASRPQVAFINATGAGILRGPAIEAIDIDRLLGRWTPLGFDVHGRVAARHGDGRRWRAKRAAVAQALAAAPPADVLAGHSAVDRVLAGGFASTAAGASTRLQDGAASHAPAVLAAWTPPASRALPLPEQVEVMRRWLEQPFRRRSSALAAGDAARADACLSAALGHLRDLRRHLRSALPARDMSAAGLPTARWAPAPLLLDWDDTARRIAGDFSACLVDALQAAGDGTDTGLSQPEGYFEEWPHPRADATAPCPDARPDSDLDYLLGSLVWQWCTVRALLGDADIVERRVLELLALYVPDPPASRLPILTGRLHVGEDSAGRGEDAWLPVLEHHSRAFMMRAATGLLTTRVPPAVEGRDDALRAGREGRVRLSLRPPGLGGNRDGGPAGWTSVSVPHECLDAIRCSRLVPLSDDEALLTPVEGPGSNILSADGRIVAAEPWPEPVRGEQPFAGGRAAWTAPLDSGGVAALFVRDAAGGAVRRYPLPLAPSDACAIGRTIYLATDRGLFAWTEADGIREIAAGMALSAICTNVDAGVRAYALRAGNGDEPRHAAVEAWDYDERRQALAEVRVVPGTASLAAASRGPWRAEAWTDAGLVHLVHASGARFWLAVSAPRTLAWVGPSLVVALLPSGHVMRFQDLEARLNTWVERLLRP